MKKSFTKNPNWDYYKREYDTLFDKINQAFDNNDDVAVWHISHQLQELEDQYVKDEELGPGDENYNRDLDSKFKKMYRRISKRYGTIKPISDVEESEFINEEGIDPSLNWPMIPTPEGYASGHEGNIGASEALWATNTLRMRGKHPGHGFKRNPKNVKVILAGLGIILVAKLLVR